MQFLRQSTASQEVLLGPFVDSTDGNTEETALTIANTDIKIWKTGATTLANKNSGGATHISNGEYYAVLDATDTDTIGPMVIRVHVAGALAVRLFCTVLDEAVYDVLFGTVAPATATNITAATGVTLAAVTHTGAVIPVVSALTGHVGQTGDCFTRLGAPAGASVSADIAGVQSDTNDIQTRIPAVLVGGRMDSSVGAAAADTLTASALATDAVNEIADGVRARQLTESYAADGVAPTLEQALLLIQQMLTEMSIAGTTMTIKKLDGTTTAATLTLNDATTPTSVTRAT